MDDFGIRGAFFSFEIEDWNIEFKNKIINQLQLGKFWKKNEKQKATPIPELFILRMVLSVHSPSKVWYDQNFSTSRYNENLWKINHINDTEKYILHNNNAEKLLKNCKKNCLINKRITYLILF